MSVSQNFVSPTFGASGGQHLQTEQSQRNDSVGSLGAPSAFNATSSKAISLTPSTIKEKAADKLASSSTKK